MHFIYTDTQTHTHTHTPCALDAYLPCLIFSSILRCMLSSLHLVLSFLFVHLAVYVFLVASHVVCSSRASCGVCFPLCILCCLVFAYILRSMFSSLHLVLSALLAHLAVYVFLFASSVVWSSRPFCGVCFPLCGMVYGMGHGMVYGMEYGMLYDLVYDVVCEFWLRVYCCC